MFSTFWQKWNYDNYFIVHLCFPVRNVGSSSWLKLSFGNFTSLLQFRWGGFKPVFFSTVWGASWISLLAQKNEIIRDKGLRPERLVTVSNDNHYQPWSRSRYKSWLKIYQSRMIGTGFFSISEILVITTRD